LHILSSVPAEIEHAVIIGHNPGMEALVSGLCTGSTVRLNLSMPTAALAHLELDIRWWNQIRWGCGQLKILLKPKLLRTR
jgi:phosphohistidine phosphatase